MNTEIKAGLDTALSVVNMVVHLVEKKGTVVAVEDLTDIATKLKAAVQGWGNVGTEVKSLATVESETDILAYIEQKVAEIGGDSKYTGLIVSALKLFGSMAINSYGLVQSYHTSGVTVPTPSPAAK